MYKLKIAYHTLLSNYHGVLLDSFTDKQCTRLYLKHWAQYTRHRDTAAALRIREKIMAIRDMDDL